MGYFKTLKQKLAADITTVPQIVSASYFPALDGLRAVAVMLVILYHFSLNHYLRPYHILINGDFGVDIFFVISGFLITTLLLKEKVQYGNISLKRFYIRRALRILPAAYAFLLMLIILNICYHFKITTSQFAASFLFYKNWPYQFEPYSGHFWSLAAEVQFYLIFPFLLTLNINRYLVIVFSIVIAVPIIAILGYYYVDFLKANAYLRQLTKINRYFFWNGPYIILIGSLFAVLLFKRIIYPDKIKEHYFLGAVLFLIAIIITSKAFMFYKPYLSEFIATVLIAWVMPLNLKGGFLSKILASKILVKVGLISYSLYLWQQPFLGIRTWQPWMQVFSSYPLWALILVRMIMVFSIASASYYFIEKPFLKLKKRFE